MKWDPRNHDGLLIAVEIELDNDVHIMPCPLMKQACGSTDYDAIRQYFDKQDYSVGQILSIHHGMLSFLQDTPH